MDDFAKSFAALTGHPPFPWQEELYARWIGQGPQNGNAPQSTRFPQVCNVPTGLGKTNVIAVWLLALAKCPGELPRRLVYVVNRRTVVDQTTFEVDFQIAIFTKEQTNG